ncbi:MAG: hypothetical protein LBF23_01885 [Endomicrobium sp.]|jgi:hypothetical protein|nr:hypothetical protein [Endomicrobium sp.]
MKECWNFTKFILNNAGNIWENGDLALRQRIQGLITPAGFYFAKNLIKFLKNPYILGIFQNENLENEYRVMIVHIEPKTYLLKCLIISLIADFTSGSGFMVKATDFSGKSRLVDFRPVVGLGEYLMELEKQRIADGHGSFFDPPLPPITDPSAF